MHWAAPIVTPDDYPGWPGWDWHDEAQLQKNLVGLEDGDLLLMCCKHSYGEWARVLADTKWDHVAIVVRHRPRKTKVAETEEFKRMSQLRAKFPGVDEYHKVSDENVDRDYDVSEPTGNPLLDTEIFESTGDGVHIYNLVSRLRDDPKFASRYETIALRKLNCTRTPEMLEALDEIIAAYRGLPFEQNREELKAALFRRASADRDTRSMFCAELNAECLQAMKVLSDERHSNGYLSCDFSSENPVYGVKVTNGASLSAEVIIKAPHAQKRSPDKPRRDSE